MSVKNIADVVGNVPIDIQSEPQPAIPEFGAVENESQPGAFEILPGMTVEEMKSMFFDTTALIEPNYRVYQLNSKGHRYY